MNPVALMSKHCKIYEQDRYFTVKSLAKKNRQLGVWPSNEFTIRDFQGDFNRMGFKDVFVIKDHTLFVNEMKFWQALITIRDIKFIKVKGLF